MSCCIFRSSGAIVASLLASSLVAATVLLSANAGADDGTKAPPASEKSPAKAVDKDKQRDKDSDKGKEKEKEKDKDKDKSKDHAGKHGDPWPLAVCALAGEKLGDDAVTVVHEGRELRFCCSKCVAKFKEDPKSVLAKADARIVADQIKFYPLQTCLIMEDEPLVEGEIEDVVHNNRLFRFCCAKCVRKFKADPGTYWAKLDEAVIAAQKPGYAIKTCPVSGEALGAHGEPVDLVVANRLVRLCCKGCVKEAKKDPAAVLAKVAAK